MAAICNKIYFQFFNFSMLDDLSTDMERTGMKMDEMMKKIAKVTNMNDGTF